MVYLTSANMEEPMFMTYMYTAARHQEALQIVWLHFKVTGMSNIC